MRQTFNNPLLIEPSRPMPRRVAIVGSGSIGPDIGYYIKGAVPGVTVAVIDVNQDALDAAQKRWKGYAEKAVVRGKLDAAGAAAMLENAVFTQDYAALEGADWVIEAATENLALKRRIFAEIEKRVSADAIITSNTSSLPAASVFGELKHRGRTGITHFFAPAWRNPAVEVVGWKDTDPKVVDWLRGFFGATGKVPLAAADVPCFMLDRIFDNWCNEAAHLLDESELRATAAEIDTVAAEFVHAGPFFVLNLAQGNPIILATNTLQADEEGEHYRPAAIFRSVDKWLTVAPGRSVPVDPEKAAAIRDRLLGVLLSQSVDILDRSIGTAADLDLGCRIALGFKQGPVELLKAFGPAEAQRILDRFVKERPGMPAAKRPMAHYAGLERHVLVDDLEGGVKLITMRRPDRLNALDDTMTDEILAVIRRFEADPAVTGFVLMGEGTRAFCAGADIGRFPTMLGDAKAAAQYARDCARLLVHLDGMKKPVVAALNGMALGGGFELAMRCHALVATRRASMQLPEISLGIAAGLGAMVVPYRRWPKAAAVFHDMLRRSQPLPARQALELGVIEGIAEGVRGLVALAVERVKALAGKPRASLDAPVALPGFTRGEAKTAQGQALSAAATALIERTVQAAAAAPSLAAALEIGYRAFGESACLPAAREGITAFNEKRAPDFGATG